MAQDNNPELNDLLNQFKQEIFIDLNAVQVGSVEAFYPETQTVDVQISVKHVVSIGADGTPVLENRPLLLACPVMILSGGASYITMPIQKGDQCVIFFNDRELDNWFAKGGIQAPVTSRAHDMSDAIAFIGVRNLQTSIAGYDEDNVVIANGDASLKIGEMGAVFTGALSAATLNAGNGATGVFERVNVVNGIVVGGI